MAENECGNGKALFKKQTVDERIQIKGDIAPGQYIHKCAKQISDKGQNIFN